MRQKNKKQRLRSNFPTLLVQHIANFSFVNKNKKVVAENNYVELQSVSKVLSPRLLNFITYRIFEVKA